jgi:hypothetical protein
MNEKGVGKEKSKNEKDKEDTGVHPIVLALSKVMRQGGWVSMHIPQTPIPASKDAGSNELKFAHVVTLMVCDQCLIVFKETKDFKVCPLELMSCFHYVCCQDCKDSHKLQCKGRPRAYDCLDIISKVSKDPPRVVMDGQPITKETRMMLLDLVQPLTICSLALNDATCISVLSKPVAFMVSEAKERKDNYCIVCFCGTWTLFTIT